MRRKPVKARRKAAAPKRRAAPKGVKAVKPARRRKSSAAVQETEVARLKRELRQSLDQQTATADVLRVISSSPGDLEPVFQSMLENAVHICEASAGNIYRWDGQELRLAAAHNTPPAFVELLKRTPQRATTDNLVGHMLAAKTLIHTTDVSTQRAYLERREPLSVAAVELGGVRTLLVVPMLKDDELIGAFTLYRSEVRHGFYAATKRKAQADGGAYEPTLTAATKSLGHSVEIRIRDNGTGIPPEVKEKMFNPFFTTKPAGEGTGLGLSLSHDIVVKQHSGSIEVDTQPGAFTEFRIVLPRGAAGVGKPGERA